MAPLVTSWSSDGVNDACFSKLPGPRRPVAGKAPAVEVSGVQMEISITRRNSVKKQVQDNTTRDHTCLVHHCSISASLERGMKAAFTLRTLLPRRFSSLVSGGGGIPSLVALSFSTSSRLLLLISTEGEPLH